MKEVELGIKMNGTYINNIMYADDIVLLANTIQDLQELVDEVDDIGRRYGLNINVKKTKTMIISREQHLDAQVVINGKLVVERVKEFKYLSTLVPEDLNPEIEIKTLAQQSCARKAGFLYLLKQQFSFSLKHKY